LPSQVGVCAAVRQSIDLRLSCPGIWAHLAI
jgi:hypothetical protein